MNIFTFGLSNEAVAGSRGLKILPDKSIHSVDINDLDALIIPGGYPGYINLANNASVIQLVKCMHSSSKYLASICAGPIVLENAGVLTGKRVTCYPGVETNLKSASVSKDRVLVDDKIVTSRGPGTALAFSLKLVELLFNEKKMKEVRGPLVIYT